MLRGDLRTDAPCIAPLQTLLRPLDQPLYGKRLHTPYTRHGEVRLTRAWLEQRGGVPSAAPLSWIMALAASPVRSPLRALYARWTVPRLQCSCMRAALGEEGASADDARLDGTWNPPRSFLDLYTPRYVRGQGGMREGLCTVWCACAMCAHAATRWGV